MGYNGWTNYETWLVNLWMDNEPGGKEFIWEWLGERSVGVQAGRLAQFLEETYAEGADDLSLPPFWNDLLRGALSEVNWMETASHIMDEWKEKEND